MMMTATVMSLVGVAQSDLRGLLWVGGSWECVRGGRVAGVCVWGGEDVGKGAAQDTCSRDASIAHRGACLPPTCPTYHVTLAVCGCVCCWVAGGGKGEGSLPDPMVRQSNAEKDGTSMQRLSLGLRYRPPTRSLTERCLL